MVATTMAPITDPNTLANHHSVVTEDTTIDVVLDFKTSSVSGDVILKLKLLEGDVGEVVLDTSYLDIKCVAVGGKAATWKLDGRKEPYGSALTIALADKLGAGDSIDVMVRTADLERGGGGWYSSRRIADGSRSLTAPRRNVPRFSG